MPRFFVEKCLSDQDQEIVLINEDAHHIIDVLRLKVNDRITICDGAGTDAETIIKKMSEQSVYLEIIAKTVNKTESRWQFTLFQGLPKGDKMDYIIQKSVELGIRQIVPVQCSRSVAKIKSNAVGKKVQRWNRIALEAAKQSGRGFIPKVFLPISFAEALEQLLEFDIAFMPWENERSLSLKKYLSELDNSLQYKFTGGFIIGPEGGFSNQEAELAFSRGITPVTLGPRILRTETAAVAVLSMLGYQYDQI